MDEFGVLLQVMVIASTDCFGIGFFLSYQLYILSNSEMYSICKCV